MDNSSVSRKKQLINLCIIGVLIFLTFYALQKITGHLDIHYLWSIYRHMNPVWLGLALGSMVMVAVFEGQCLTILAKPLGYKIPFHRATAYAAADLYFSAITPSATGGQPASGYYMVKDGVKGSDATAVLVMNIFQYTSALLTLGIFSVIFQWNFLLDAGWIFQCLFIVGFVLQSLLVALCLACMFSDSLVDKLQNMAAGIINRMKFIKRKEARIRRLSRYISRYRVGMDQMKKEQGARVLSFIGNFLQRLAFFAVGYCIYRSLGFDQFNYVQIMTIQCLLAMITYNLPVPGGIGLSEGGFLWLFSKVYPKAILTPAMLATRGINYYLCFLLCGIYTMIHHVVMLRRNRRNNQCV